MNSQHNQVNGINIGLMDKLILDLTRYIDDINDIFNSLDEEVTKSYSYIPSPVLETFKSNYCEIKENYSVINSSIQSYCTDYAKVKAVYNNRDMDIANSIKKMNSKELNSYVEEGR